MLVVDVIDEFIAGLDLSSQITFAVIASETIIVVEEVFHARAGLNCKIDGVDFKILEVDYDSKNITVLGAPATANIFSMNPPFYFHGTPYATNAHISRLKDSEKVPMIYLLEILREEIQAEDSVFESIAELRFFFLDVANFEAWSTDEHYAKVIRPQRNLVDAFIKQARQSKLFGEIGELMLVPHVKFGVYQSEKGHLNSLFNDRLSGIELKGSFPIRCCDC